MSEEKIPQAPVEPAPPVLTKKQKYRKNVKERKLKNKAQEERNEQIANMTKEAEDRLFATANEIFDKYKEVENDKEYMQKTDKQKIEYFRDKLGYVNFFNDFPIMARYMVCTGKYSPKAFRRYLDKCKLVKHPPPEKRPKNYMEDQWIMRQADYVRYLWESEQRGHVDFKRAQAVWEHAYKSLRGEFDDFRDKYKNVEEDVKKDKIKYQAENARELLSRIASGEQQLGERSTYILLQMLKDIAIKKKYKTEVMGELGKKLIGNKRVAEEKVVVGEGTRRMRPDGTMVGGADDKNVPTIKMIAHADEEEYATIPQQYRLEEDIEEWGLGIKDKKL
jgi:hypothetical protein